MTIAETCQGDPVITYRVEVGSRAKTVFLPHLFSPFTIQRDN